jgi:hypothetical protein
MRKWLTGMLFVGCALAWVTPGIARAQAIENYKLPGTFLNGVKPSTAHRNDNATAVARKKNAGLAGTVTSNASNSGVPGIDSLQNWVGQFTASGFDPQRQCRDGVALRHGWQTARIQQHLTYSRPAHSRDCGTARFEWQARA